MSFSHKRNRAYVETPIRAALQPNVSPITKTLGSDRVTTRSALHRPCSCLIFLLRCTLRFSDIPESVYANWLIIMVAAENRLALADG
jgi:hypothetical protein